MKITLASNQAQPTEEQARKLNKLGDFTVLRAEKWTAEQAIAEIKQTDVLIAGPSGITKIDEQLLAGLSGLKLVSTLTVNTTWIDLQAAKKHDVIISTIKGANSESVAEHAWGMILDLAKRITEFNRDAIQKGSYNFKEYVGVELAGKTIGIIGLGDIGKKVARIAKAFDMKILGVNKSGQKVAGIQVVTLDELFAQSDVIVVATPLTDETKDIIGADEVQKMKDGVIIVNPAVAELTNKQAILDGLESGKIFGFGIETDILKQIPQDDPYLTHPRIIATPHNAFNTIDAERKSFDVVIENIEAFIAGRPKNMTKKQS